MLLEFKLKLNKDIDGYHKKGYEGTFFIDVGSLARFPIDDHWDILSVKDHHNNSIPKEQFKEIKQLGYYQPEYWISCPTYSAVFQWVKSKWGFYSWIEQTGDDLFKCKIYKKGAFHSPKYSQSFKWYHKDYDVAELLLLRQLIAIIQEIEGKS